MKINIFEGARRITLLLAVFWVLGVVVTVWEKEPDISVTYASSWPDQHPVLVASDKPWERACLVSDATDWNSRNTSNGVRVGVTICLRAQKSKNGGMLIPYRVDRETGQWWGAEPRSLEVMNYEKQVWQSLSFSPADEEWINAKYWPARLRQIAAGAGWLIGGLVVLWIFVFIVGWIVRGFSGIPMGKDRNE